MSAVVHADPCLTANLYCNRRLELVAREVLGGLSADLAAEAPPDSFFWYTRYGRCGEHVKVRVHGPESAAALARASLPVHAECFFATPASDPDPNAWVSKPGIPPVDLEDERDEDYPNKSLLWTTYRRSPVVLGAEVYLADDAHVLHFCRCQATVTRIALDVLLPRLGTATYFQHRQATFLRLLLTAVSVLHLSVEATIAYLGYHRDWLVRALVHNGTTPETTTFEGLSDELRERAEASAAGLRPLTGHVERALAESRQSTDYCLAFHRELTDFYAHVTTYRGDETYDEDPYTRDFAFLPVFKVLHLAANQFGFRLSHEAYVYTLLLLAAEPLATSSAGLS